MSKARDIADLVSAGNILADGAIATTEITGVTATSAELNYNDITTLGTVEASKVVTANSSGSISIAADGTFSPANNSIILGSASEFRLFEDSSGSNIVGSNNIDLYTDGSITLYSGVPTSVPLETMATFVGDGAVSLRYDNVTKFATTSTGIDVTGTADMDTLSIGGTAVTSTAAELNILAGVTATATELNYNDITTLGTSQSSKVVTADANGNVKLTEELQTTCYLETVVALSGTSPTVDCDEGNSFTLSTSGNTTFTFSYAGVNLTTNDAYGFTLKITAGGTHTLTWPGSVDWAGGTAPDAPASGETDVYVFYTVDGGTNWYGALAIDAAA